MLESNPFTRVVELATSYIVSRCLHVVADLGIADVLDDTPLTATQLARQVGADPDAIYRVLRLLAAHGVFVIQGDSFGHSPASRLLRDDHPQSMRAFVRVFGLPFQWTTYGALDYSARTGLPALPTVVPGGYWNYVMTHSDAGTIFNRAMEGKAQMQIAAILAAYDFSHFRVIGDIGGGLGHLLVAVLDAVPAAKGFLFDLPHVLDSTKDIASERFVLQAGDFFKDTLPTCDAYLLMEIIHDWGDEQALAILRAVRQAAQAQARLLVIEQLVSDDPGPDWAKALDIQMLVNLGGRQRTRHAYEALFHSTGFSFQRQIDTDADISILEAVAV